MTTDLSRPRILTHLAKAALCGFAGYRLGLLALSWPAPWNWLLGVAAWLLLASFFRNLHALAARPVVRAGTDGLALRYWRPTPFLSWAMLLPCERVTDVFIPWADYLGCRAARYSGSDPWDSYEILRVDAVSGSHEIGSDVFAGSADGLMAAICAFTETADGADARAPARFNSRRFARPLLLQWAESGSKSSAAEMGCGIVIAVVVVPLMLVMAGAMGVLAVLGLMMALRFVAAPEWVAWLDSFKVMDEIQFLGTKAPLAIVVGAVGGVLVLLAMATRWLLQDLARGRTRVVQLRGDGLAVGSRPDTLRLVPWTDILRADVMRQTTWTTFGDGRTVESTTRSLEIHARGRSPIILPDEYGRSLADIGELVAPSPRKAALALALMDGGTEAEEAAEAAGLPPARPARVRSGVDVGGGR